MTPPTRTTRGANKKSNSTENPKKVNLHKCCFCEYTNHAKHLLVSHLMSHTGERPFKCDECIKAFKTKRALAHHKNIHAGIKPWKCHFCTKAFTTHGEQIRHERFIHTKEKPHKCPQCDFASVMKRRLKDHIFSQHSGDSTGRKFKCKRCDFNTGNYTQYTSHLLRHKRKGSWDLTIKANTGDGPHKCGDCGKRYQTKAVLTRHTRSKHSISTWAAEVKFICDKCPSGFNSVGDFNYHRRTTHDLDEPIRDHHSEETRNKRRDSREKVTSKLSGDPNALYQSGGRNSDVPAMNEKKLLPCTNCSRAFRTVRQWKCHKCINLKDFCDEERVGQVVIKFEETDEYFEDLFIVKAMNVTAQFEDNWENSESRVKIEDRYEGLSVKNENVVSVKIEEAENSDSSDKDPKDLRHLKNETACDSVKNMKKWDFEDTSVKIEPGGGDFPYSGCAMDDWDEVDGKEELWLYDGVKSESKVSDEELSNCDFGFSGSSSPEL